jgi:hypothetical protein
MVSKYPGVVLFTVLQEVAAVEGHDAPAAGIAISTAKKLNVGGEPGVTPGAEAQSISVRSSTLPIRLVRFSMA